MVLIVLGMIACGPKATVPAASAETRSAVAEYNRTSLWNLDVDLEEGDVSLIRQVVLEHLPEIDPCFLDYAQRVPGASGRVELDFYVRGGRVTSHTVFANNTGDVTVARCIGNVVKKWPFDEGVEGEVLAAFLMLDEA